MKVIFNSIVSFALSIVAIALAFAAVPFLAAGGILLLMGSATNSMTKQAP